MARKKRDSDGGKKKKPKPPAGLPVPRDPRALEGTMRRFVREQRGDAGAETPADQAQALMYRAFEERRPERRLRLAKEALAIWPDCADAYVLLAEHSRKRKEALELYQKGVDAGERAVGPRAIQEAVGHFWGVLETRPYMRARLGLALALWSAGRRDEAVGHLQDMLRLNPGDNQGVRYTLAGFLLFLDRDDELARLLDQYPDEGSAAWAYTRALLAFRRDGDTLAARRLLKTARKANKHVPPYLLGQKFPPAEPPGYYSPGDESDALHYVGGFLAGWKSTPGAVAWLRANVKTGKGKADAPRPKGPLALVKKWLKERLPQQPDVWQADFLQTPNWIGIAGERVRPWLVLVTSRDNDLVLAHELADEKPSPALLWDALVQAMQHPAVGDAHRPTEVQARAGDPWDSLRSPLEEIGVALVAVEALDHADAVLKEMSEHVVGKPQPGLLDAPGVTPGQVGGFYEAAAHFFREAPWKKVGYEAAVKVECDRFQSGPWYAVLMGQSGLTIGLALYEDLELLKRMWEGDSGDEENARRTVSTAVTFGEESDIPVADLEAAKRHGWKTARPDAYPAVFHKERGMSLRPPLAWELELMEGCLRAIPGFVKRHGQDDPAREEVTVKAASGELKLALSWVVDE